MTHQFKLNLNKLDEFSAILANFIRQDLILCLVGELGSGKTTFVRSFVKNLGIDELVSSPTYSIENEYKDINSKYLVRHVDLYRGLSESEQLQLFERSRLKSIEILIIEWSNLLLFPVRGEHLVIEFEFPIFSDLVSLSSSNEIREVKILGDTCFLEPISREIQRKLG